MRKIYLLVIGMCFGCAYGQDDSKFSISSYIGPNMNFAATNFEEVQGPQPAKYYYNKRLLGYAIGLEGRYQISKRLSILAGYQFSSNRRVVSYDSLFNQQTYLFIYNVNLYQNDNNYYGGLEYNRQKGKNIWGIAAGMMYASYKIQDIELIYFDNTIAFNERNSKNAGLNSFGSFAGFKYARQIEPCLKIGLQSRLFFDISNGEFTQLTFTPSVTYTFSKKKK